MVRFSDLLGRLPWWVAALLGALAVGLGLTLIARPFDSLTVLVLIVAASFVVTGISELASAREEPNAWLTALVGLAWVVAGVAVVSWPGLSIRGVALFVGVTMLAGGFIRLVSAVREPGDRLISALSGFASVIFGALALAWPDVTTVIVALLVGPRMFLFGVGQIAAAFTRRKGSGDTPDWDRPRWSRRTRLLGAGATLTVALGLVALSAWLRGSTPIIDDFYDPPVTVAAEPGVLLRAEPFTRAVPPGARAWRILYTTTRDDDTPGVASALVVTPEGSPDEPRPVIAWAHGTTGVERPCAPSLLNEPFESGALLTIDRIIAEGWVLVATDYIGLGTPGPHPYLIGEGEGRSVLDAVRVARQMEDLKLGPDTVVWGHSQGGHAALWTGILAPEYAPDVDLVGVAALAPASDLSGMAEEFQESPVSLILMAYIMRAYSQNYSDVRYNDYVRPEAREIMRGLASRCLAEPAALVSIVVSLPIERPVLSTSPLTGALGERLASNVPTGPIDAPLLIAQGASDSLVLPDMQAQFVDDRCAAGQRLEYRSYEGRDHISLVAAGSPLIPDLIDWTKDRLAGVEEPPGCRSGTVPD